jgi:hypothetical protein
MQAGKATAQSRTGMSHTMTDPNFAAEKKLLQARLAELNLPDFESSNALAMIERGDFIGGLASAAWQALERKAGGVATPDDEKILMEAQLRALNITEFDRANAQAMLRRGEILGGLAMNAWQAVSGSERGPAEDKKD